MNDDELLERALRDELAPDEETALAARLKAEPPLARRMVELAREEAILTEWGTERGLTLEAAAQPASSHWSIRPLVAAAILLAAGLGVFLFLPRAPEDRPELAASEGPVEWDRRSLRCGGGGHATLRYSGGTTIEAREKTELLLEPRGLRLLSGSIAADVILPRGASFAVATPHAEARVLGTRFEVVVGTDSTRLLVEEGRVQFAGLEVPAGHFAVARPGRPSIVHPFRGSGLRGEYYDASDLTHPRLSRLDPAIDFDWGKGAADPSLKSDAFSVRWSGRLLPRAAGTYTFTSSSDDGARLWVDGKLLIDEFHVQGRKEHSATIELAAWEPVELRMEYLDTDGPAQAHLYWSSPALPRQIVPTDALFPGPPDGTGLKGEYFGTRDFRELKLTRVDPTIHFAWGLRPPHPSLDAHDYSVRWTGQIEAPQTETVTFTTVSDDGVRLRVDGQLLIDDWTVRGSAERSGQIDLVAGRRYDLTLEYFQAVSTAAVKLLWASPGRTQELVPQARLFPAP